jgi:hypothetical protein
VADWLITWGGKSWTVEDWTVAHMTANVMCRGVDDWDFDPSKGPMRLTYLIAAFIAMDEDRPIRTVVAELMALPLSTVVAALDVS